MAKRAANSPRKSAIVQGIGRVRETAGRSSKLAELARKQQELADKANDLAKETKLPTQAAKTNPLKPEIQKAAER